MADANADTEGIGASFSEKDFYLAEFRRRSLGLVVPVLDATAVPIVRSVLDDLVENRTRCVVVAASGGVLGDLGIRGPATDRADPHWERALWQALRAHMCVGVMQREGAALAQAARDVALRLRLAKLVWLDERGALEQRDGTRISYLGLEDLDALAEGQIGGSTVRGLELGGRAPLLRELRSLLAGGLPSAAICTPAGLADELFTFAGAGTFFTRERYLEVRALGVDELDAACDLIRRGVEEGYLVARDEAGLAEVLANAFGVFVERRYLAGIGALIPHARERAGELGSLYTLTRFVGEGVGSHLVAFALERARSLGCEYVYACTTREPVVGFFARNGFAQVGAEAIPQDKWRGYPPGRRQAVTCLRRDL